MPFQNSFQKSKDIVQDVTFTNNLLRHSGSAIAIFSKDDIHPSQQTKRITMRNNLFTDIDANKWGGFGRLFEIYNGTADVVIDHNTGLQTGEIIVDTTYATVPGDPNTGFVFQNNIAPHNQYGVAGLGTRGDPMLTLSTYFPNAIFVRNILAGGNSSDYPHDNFFPPSLADVGFVDSAGGNYRLGASSPYRNAGTDGKDLGPDIDALDSITAGVAGGSIPDSLAPSVSISSPGDGATVTGTVIVLASATDNMVIAGVQFTLDGAHLGPEITAGPYEVSWDTTSAAIGLHTLRAVARDAAGNLSASAVTITVGRVDSKPPAISGVAASPVTSSGVTITWSTDEASDSIVFYGPTTAYGATSSSPAMVTANSLTLTGLSANTQYHYRVKSTDASGNSAISGDFIFTTPGGAVTVSITAPSAGARVSGKIKVTAKATAPAGVAFVLFRLDGRDLGAKDTAAPYVVTWDTRRSSNGTHTLTAVATDWAGNSAAAVPITVTVANGR